MSNAVPGRRPADQIPSQFAAAAIVYARAGRVEELKWAGRVEKGRKRAGRWQDELKRAGRGHVKLKRAGRGQEELRRAGRGYADREGNGGLPRRQLAVQCPAGDSSEWHLPAAEMADAASRGGAPAEGDDRRELRRQRDTRRRRGKDKEPRRLRNLGRGHEIF